jgi:rhamnopyranosyl-N-acetylglucosaminyl-diphospho-decaprenol beta-1,3/1,4-galactofuranosyltransferase
MNDKVCAVVVTYNRKNLLIECLESLRKQSRPIQGIYLIDNASTDGTSELLLEKDYLRKLPPKNLNEPWEKEFAIQNLTDGNEIKLHYVKMHENTGGAGGFYEGVKRGYEKGYDWLWLMDDDVIPESNCLEILYKNYRYLSNYVKVGFICPSPYNIDSNPDVMSLPPIAYKVDKFFYISLYRDDNQVLPVLSCGFGGVLVSSLSIKEVGFPIKEFFIWNDDYEWTRRITRNGFYGFISLDCRIIHKTKNTGVNPENLGIERIHLLYYEIRNKAFIFKQDFSFLKFMKIYLKFFLKILYRILKRNDINKKFRIFIILFKGFLDGLFFNPKIEKP